MNHEQQAEAHVLEEIKTLEIALSRKWGGGDLFWTDSCVKVRVSAREQNFMYVPDIDFGWSSGGNNNAEPEELAKALTQFHSEAVAWIEHSRRVMTHMCNLWNERTQYAKKRDQEEKGEAV